MIQENPYMQYLCGLSEFTDKPIFDASLFVTIRKRISMEEINDMVTSLLNRELKKKEDKKQSNDQGKSNGNISSSANQDDNGAEFTDTQGRKHKGRLKMPSADLHA